MIMRICDRDINNVSRVNYKSFKKMPAENTSLDCNNPPIPTHNATINILCLSGEKIKKIPLEPKVIRLFPFRACAQYTNDKTLIKTLYFLVLFSFVCCFFSLSCVGRYLLGPSFKPAGEGRQPSEWNTTLHQERRPQRRKPRWGDAVTNTRYILTRCSSVRAGLWRRWNSLYIVLQTTLRTLVQNTVLLQLLYGRRYTMCVRVCVVRVGVRVGVGAGGSIGVVLSYVSRGFLI